MPATLRSPAPPLTRATAPPITSPADCYSRALRLGFTFPQIAGGGGARLAIGPADAAPQQAAEVELVRDYLARDEQQVLALADAKPGLARPPARPRKIGTDPFGRPLPDVDAPPAEEPPHFTPSKPYMLPVEKLTDAELSQEVRSVETEAGIIDGTLAGLGEEQEGEDWQVTNERNRQHGRLHRIAGRLREVEAEQSRRLFARIDAAEAERVNAAGPRVLVNWWHSGRTA